MNSILILNLIGSLVALVHGQTSYTTYCPTGINTNYKATSYVSLLAPVTTLAGVTYNTGGFYAVTASNGAEQCCYNCRTQTGGKCTTWTYDGCGKCYLSSAT